MTSTIERKTCTGQSSEKVGFDSFEHYAAPVAGPILRSNHTLNAVPVLKTSQPRVVFRNRGATAFLVQKEIEHSQLEVGIALTIAVEQVPSVKFGIWEFVIRLHHAMSTDFHTHSSWQRCQLQISPEQ